MIERGSLPEREFAAVTHIVAVGLLGMVDRLEIAADDATAILGSAFLEAMGQRLGKFGAIERLRLLADIAEREALADLKH